MREPRTEEQPGGTRRESAGSETQAELHATRKSRVETLVSEDETKRPFEETEIAVSAMPDALIGRRKG
jgi:hypothetical protein